MKAICKRIVFVITLLALAANAHAQSPREQLQQLTAQLQKTPNDNALRESIIKLATTLKPAPAIPEEANRREGRGKFAFRSAKSNEDFLAAAVEFEEAAKLAPWVAGYYSDLCTIYEKAEKYAEAKRNCEVYLASLADPAQISEVRQRIAGIEFGIEKATATKAAADTPQAREAALLQKVEGAKFVYHTNNPQVRTDDIYEIRNRTLVLTYRIYSYTSQNLKYGKGPAPGDYLISRAPYRDGAFNLPFDGGFTQVYRIRPDGQALIAVEGFYNSNPNDRSFGNRSLVIPRE